MSSQVSRGTFAVDGAVLRQVSALMRGAGEQAGAGRLPRAAGDLAGALPATMSAWACADLAEGWGTRVTLWAAGAAAAGELLRALADDTAALDRFLADAADGDLGDAVPAGRPPRRGPGAVML